MPGSYVARLTIDGRQLRQTFVIAPDPRAQQTAAERSAHVAYQTQLYDALSRIDVALNTLDNVQLELPRRIETLVRMPAARVLLADARATLDGANAEASALSSHPENGQDDDFLRDVLRERVNSLLNATYTLSPTAEESRASEQVIRETNVVLAAHALLMSRIAPLQTALQAAKLAPLDLTALPKASPPGERHDERGSRDQ
jgi:hypothetical protein